MEEQSPSESKTTGGIVLEVNKSGTLITVDFPNAKFIASHMRETNGDFWAELQVYADLPTPNGNVMTQINRSKFNLLDDYKVLKLIDTLEEKTADYPSYYWGSLVDSAKDAIIDTKREGDPAVVIGNLDEYKPRIYDIRPMFVKGVANLMWAPGGSAKSYWALLSCVMVDKGLDIMGLRARRGKALFLDWEETEDVFRHRLSAIHKGLGLQSDSGIVYKKMYGTLADNVENLSKLIMNQNITYMVIDSVGQAMGGNGVDQDVVERYFAAGNVFGITWVSIDHANRAGESTGNWQIHGSAFKYARSRQVYEFKKVQELDSGEIEVMIYHRKANDSGIKSPRGYRVTFESIPEYVAEIDEYEQRLDKVTFNELSLGDADDSFMQNLSIGQICYQLVKANGSTKLDRLAIEVSRIKDVDSVTEDTIKSSVESYNLVIDGTREYPMKVGADGQTVHIVQTVTQDEEEQEWSSD